MRKESSRYIDLDFVQKDEQLVFSPVERYDFIFGGTFEYKEREVVYTLAQHPISGNRSLLIEGYKVGETKTTDGVVMRAEFVDPNDKDEITSLLEDILEETEFIFTMLPKPDANSEYATKDTKVTVRFRH